MRQSPYTESRPTHGLHLCARCLQTVIVGRVSVVDIATRYGLDEPGIEPRWEARLFAPVQTGSEAHPVSHTVGTGSPSRE